MRSFLCSTLVGTVMSLVCTGHAHGQSIYYLDFDPVDTGSFHPYSEGEKMAVLDEIAAMYAAFPHMSFTLDEPVEPHSTVSFNSPAIGTSTGIDFRNIADIDDAAVNAMDGIEFASPGYAPSPTEIVKASANLAAHEIGHLEGLRHHDSFTPIGGGVPSPSVAAGFDDPYPGPPDAFLSDTDVQSLTTATAGGSGFTLAKLTGDLIVGQRSAQKLAFNADPAFFSESAIASGPHATPASATPLPLKTLGIPNLAPEGTPGHGEDFLIDTIAVAGEIGLTSEGTSEFDYYSFAGVEGARVQIEVLSEIIDPRLDELDVVVSILDPDELSLGIYYGGTTNENEIESTDALILDFVVPETKDYLIAVFPEFTVAAGPEPTGEYELFVSQFRLIPEPTTAVMLGLLGTPLVLRRRRA